MEKTVADLFTDAVRADAARAFHAAPDDLEALGDFESYVYGYVAGGESRILRITHPSHRSAAQMEAEADWVEHQAANGVRMARPVRSARGSYTHTVAIGPSVFHACAFTRMPGQHATADDWTPQLFERWGEFLGKSHAVSSRYTPSPGVSRRQAWSDDPYITDARGWIPESEVAVLADWDRVRRELETLPEAKGAFGICHTDLHQSNFNVHEGQIHAYDTDDCSYHWFIEDISSVFFYGSKSGHSGADVRAFFAWAWPAFWDGYSREHSLSQDWLDRIHLFQRLRAQTLFALMFLKFDEGSDTRTKFLPIYRAMIESQDPIMPVDFKT